VRVGGRVGGCVGEEKKKNKKKKKKKKKKKTLFSTGDITAGVLMGGRHLMWGGRSALCRLLI